MTEIRVWPVKCLVNNIERRAIRAARKMGLRPQPAVMIDRK
jgi:hypothetical protein